MSKKKTEAEENADAANFFLQAVREGRVEFAPGWNKDEDGMTEEEMLAEILRSAMEDPEFSVSKLSPEEAEEFWREHGEEEDES